jgi:MSHA biogenesis protein MshP
MGSRAYQAARAGIEWATYQVTNPAGPTCPASTTLTLGATTLSAFTVTVTCTITAISNDTIANFYLVTSTASIGTVGKPDYIERMVTAKLGM